MSDWLYSLLIEPMETVAMQKAMIGGVLTAIVCGVVGCFIILRRMAFLGDALSHAMLAGVVAGFLIMQAYYGREVHAGAMLIGSIVSGVLTVLLIGFISRSSRIKDDTAIGVMYTGVFALGGILASIYSDKIHIHIYDYIMGMVLAVKDEHLWLMAFTAASVLSIIILFYRHFQITTFDPVMAASIGIPVALVHYLLISCTSLVVVSAVSIVGIILVVGLLITPAATAYLLCDRLSRMLVTAACLGVSSVVIGLYASYWIGKAAPGSMIVLVGTLQFLLVLMLAPKYGLLAKWIRRRQMVPQQVLEDVLGVLCRAEPRSVAMLDLNKKVAGRNDIVLRSVKQLAQRGWLNVDDQHVKLTAEGEKEANRLVRAHRLWESYLEHVGMPPEKVHAKAHVLEHLHDDAAVDYLDDKLGHPLRDPHGKEIPLDKERLASGNEVKVSALREGYSGHITAIAGELAVPQLRVGMRIVVGPRSEDGKQWSITIDNGKQIWLDHTSADAVTVKIG